MLLKEKIFTISPRENSGPISSSRFDYQKDWSLCKLLDLHKEHSDYVMIFDWHEDLVIMDSEENPFNISFYQIKGKRSGSWSITDLLRNKLKSDGKPSLSILGRLYDCKLKYDSETKSMNFISNAKFNVKLNDNSSSLAKDEICFVDLSNIDKNKIQRRIQKEHALSEEPKLDNRLFLQVVNLSLDDSATHTLGKISMFLDSYYKDRKFHLPSVYRMLFDEIKRRANYNNEVSTYQDLLNKKAISKNEFNRIIKATSIDKDYSALWVNINSELQDSGLDFRTRKEIRQSWFKLEIERMNPNNEYLFRLIEQIQYIVQSQESSYDGKSLISCIDITFEVFKFENKNSTINYTDAFIKAIIIFEIYE